MKSFHPSAPLAIMTAIPVGFANLGFSTISNIIHPMISIFYPAIIMLTCYNLISAFYPVRRMKKLVYITLFLSCALKSGILG